MHVPFRFTICGLAELGEHTNTSVQYVLSILDPGYPIPEYFTRFSERNRLELRFNDIIDETPGQLLASPADIDELLRFGQRIELDAPANVLVHCHAGVSRSTAAAALMLAQARPALSGSEIFDAMLHIRDWAWPNLRMVELGDIALGRKGELVAAAGRLYAHQINQCHELVPYFHGLSRDRELRAGFAAGAMAEELR